MQGAGLRLEGKNRFLVRCEKMKPNVIVVMCVRNAMKHISNCIRSLLDQTSKDFEIVIIDDLSIDNIKNMIEKSDDKRIRYFRNKKWLGVSNSFRRIPTDPFGFCY